MASPAYAVTVSIDGPPPSAPALTLIGASRVVPETGDRWINGASIWPYSHDLPDVFDPCQDSRSSGHAKAAGTPVSPEVFGSFTVLQGITCTTSAFGNPAEWQARAQRQLEAREHWGIEHEFWTGALKPDNPHLAQPGAGTLATDILNGGVATNVPNALALLEQAIADKGGDGVIHMRPAVFSAVSEDAVLSVSGGVAKTQLGTPVVPGVGYAGSSPAGVAATALVEWAYATGRVEVRRSEVFVVPGSMAEATDRSQNLTTFRAERYVLITWDQRIHAAVQINRSFTTFTS